MWISVDRAIRERDPAAANTLDIPVHFTRLRLLGFKSFVDPTELVIAPGLTGVVGPNGCGKSNLLEALRWVMGENRPSAMRGDGMEDVIFAGSGSRPARNHAEVTLTIDNRERLAPSAFNDADQVEIVRRITRDAGSAFRANGREARARDIQILFADASTGSHSPALVRQGQISELINARPKARRRILDSGLYKLLHNVLNDRLVHQRQHFLGHGLGLRQKACAKSRRGNDSFSNFWLRHLHPQFFFNKLLRQCRIGLALAGFHDLAG